MKPSAQGIGRRHRQWFALALAAALLPLTAGPLVAQESGGPSIALIGHVGFGLIVQDDKRESGGATLLVEFEVRRGALEWLAYGSLRGIGVNCEAEPVPGSPAGVGCDPSGQSLGVGLRRRFGVVALGGGLAMFRQSEAWHAEPHLQIVIGRTLRAQLRFEAPRDAYGTGVQLLGGFRLPIG